MTKPFLIFSCRRIRWLLILFITFSLIAAACIPLPSPSVVTPFYGQPTDMPAIAATAIASQVTQTPTATLVPAVSRGTVSSTSTNTLSPSTVTPSLLLLNGRFVFVYSDNLYIANANCVWRVSACERERTRLTNVPNRFAVGSTDLTASPDGRKIAFVYRKYDTVTESGIARETGDIYVLDVDECMVVKGGCPPERFVRLTIDPGEDYAPAWSPQGNKIIFIHQPLEPSGSGAFRLYEMNPDGSQQRLMTNELQQRGIQPTSVAWSPDGARLVMSAYSPAGSQDIFILRLSDFQIQQIIPQPNGPEELDHIRPRWSPRGDKVVFEGMSFFRVDGYLISLDGIGLTRLPLDNGPSQFTWSPDGSKLLYSGSCELYGTCLFVANADGSEPQQLPKGLGPSATLWLP